jgi:hypothetical protein
MPLSFFQALRHHLAPAGWQLLLAEREGSTLGCGLALVHQGVYLLEWAGETVEGRRLSANKLLYWSAIEQAVALRCRIFSLGRTGATNTGLLDYKRSWGTIEEDMPSLVWKNREKNGDFDDGTDDSRARRWSRTIIQKSPPWLYRRFSEFCYRHLG